MEKRVLEMAAFAESEQEIAASVEYVTAHMSNILKKNERVLICFPKRPNACCGILEQAVINCGGIPIWMGEDDRWMTILKTAFTSKCNCIVGPPLMLLGLSKIARHMGTPLYARNVLLSGYPSPRWVTEAVERGLDCKSWGCYDPGIGAVISGFSCKERYGIHIRDDVYGVDIVDGNGQILPAGEPGFVVLYPQKRPSLRLQTGNKGRLETGRCPCGCASPRLEDLDMDKRKYESLSDMGESLLYWSSILDCRMERTECGLELEAVVFQGEKLPKFPSAAKLTVRPWNPEKDRPFAHQNAVNSLLFEDKSH